MDFNQHKHICPAPWELHHVANSKTEVLFTLFDKVPVVSLEANS